MDRIVRNSGNPSIDTVANLDQFKSDDQPAVIYKNSPPSVLESHTQPVSRSEPHKTNDVLWIHLVEAQHLASDNVTINCLVYERWPESLPHTWLIDAITGHGQLMDKKALGLHIAELDHGDIEIMLMLINSMNENDTIMMRVQETKVFARLSFEKEARSESQLVDGKLPSCWQQKKMTRKDLLILLLQHEPECAEAYRLLANGLNNPFERIKWCAGDHEFSFNQSGLYEQAEFLLESSGS